MSSENKRDIVTLNGNHAADLAIAVWRIQHRALRNEATPETVKVACEIAMDRLRLLGFRLEEMVGEPYHESMRVRIVEHEGGEGQPWIAECLSPAVYFHDQLIKEAEIIVRGEGNGTTDR